MRTAADAGIAENTFCDIVRDVPLTQSACCLCSSICVMDIRQILCSIDPLQRTHWTLSRAGAAADAQMDGLRIVTVPTVKIAALQKNCCTVARPVYGAEGNDLINQCPDCHIISPCVPEPGSSWWHPDLSLWCSAGLPHRHPAFPSQNALPGIR